MRLCKLTVLLALAALLLLATVACKATGGTPGASEGEAVPAISDEEVRVKVLLVERGIVGESERSKVSELCDYARQHDWRMYRGLLRNDDDYVAPLPPSELQDTEYVLAPVIQTSYTGLLAGSESGELRSYYEGLGLDYDQAVKETRVWHEWTASQLGVPIEDWASRDPERVGEIFLSFTEEQTERWNSIVTEEYAESWEKFCTAWEERHPR